MKSKNTLVAIAVGLVLAGCGGGGSDSGSPVNQNPPPPVVVVPPPVVVDPNALQNDVAAPSYSAGTAQLAAFNAINNARATYGIGRLAENAALNTAANNHALYIRGRLEAGDYTAVDHFEDPAKPGFTGRTPLDRVQFAKYDIAAGNGAGENLSSVVEVDGVSTVPGAVAVEVLLSGPYHRFGLFDASRDVGLGHSTIRVNGEGGIRHTLVVNSSLSRGTQGQLPAKDWIGVWPADKAIGVLYSFGGETPNPIPSNGGACAGYPVSIQVKDGQLLTVGSFTITETVSGAAVRAQLSTPSTDANPAFARANTAYLIPYAPLKLNTNYTVRFAGARDGTVVDKTWTFTTRPDNVKLVYGCDPS